MLNPRPDTKIELAQTVGFCGGVGKAVRTLERCAKDGIKVETLGPVVHNRQVVDRLAGQGVTIIKSLDEAKVTNISITAHGTDPDTIKSIEARGFKVIDTTCPIVRRSQRAVISMARSKYRVLIFGDPNHPEIQGLKGWGGNDSVATLQADDIDRWTDLPRRLGIVAQTTQSDTNYSAFVCSVLRKLLYRLDEVRVVNTICSVTQNRQMAAEEMASRNDLMIVVGGNQSANTRRLAETAERVAKTHLVETAAELNPLWLKGHKRIGIIAGTSTPEDIVKQVEARVKELLRG
jgi:4-hydroxy-3-methylbut-2-enyl diphosphate reductase